MTLADRYAELTGTPVRETAETPPRKWREMELQAHWFSGAFGSRFVTQTGDSAEVVQFGVWNREAGPDFAEAAVSIAGGPPMRGAIEFDMDVRDWERHGHAANPDYESVVLHVFTTAGRSDFFTRTAQHRNVPQVRVDPAALLGADAPTQLPEAKLGRCSAPLEGLPEEKVREVIEGAAGHRLRRKAAAFARLREIHGPDEALYHGIAAALGYKNNKLPFTLLAQRLPVRMLLKSKLDAEAFFFGTSGFLPGEDLRVYSDDTRLYLRSVWERWWPRRAEYARLALEAGSWKLGGQRPVNHPQRRLAALARIVQQWGTVRTLRGKLDPAAILDFFEGVTDPYWDHHYTLESTASKSRMALVGGTRGIEMLANVFYPLAAAEGADVWPTYRLLKAPLSNRRVETAAVRLFGTRPLGRKLLTFTAMQQGLIQIYEDFCMQDATGCACCRFPQQLAKW